MVLPFKNIFRQPVPENSLPFYFYFLLQKTNDKAVLSNPDVVNFNPDLVNFNPDLVNFNPDPNVRSKPS